VSFDSIFGGFLYFFIYIMIAIISITLTVSCLKRKGQPEDHIEEIDESHKTMFETHDLTNSVPQVLTNQKSDFIMRCIIHLSTVGFLIYVLVESDQVKENFFGTTKMIYYFYLLIEFLCITAMVKERKTYPNKSVLQKSLMIDLLFTTSIVIAWYLNIYDFWVPITAFVVEIQIIHKFDKRSLESRLSLIVTDARSACMFYIMFSCWDFLIEFKSGQTVCKTKV